MGQKFEKNLIKLLYFFGISSFIYLIKKPLAKDWLLVFFIKSYYASLVDKLVVNKDYVKYPTRFPKQVWCLITYFSQFLVSFMTN